jgi:hypothetical protein
MPGAGSVSAFLVRLLILASTTRGRRYAFLAFLYAEADAARRQANNTRLHDGETLYTGAGDRLISEKAASSNE